MGLQGLGYLGMGTQGHLDVAAALDAQAPDDFEAGRPEHLVLLVGQGLAGGHHDAVAGVSAHGVQVFHVADGDAVVVAVPDYLVLDFLPAHQGTLQQHLGDGAEGKAVLDYLLELFGGVGYAAAGSAQGVGGAHHQGQPHVVAVGPGLFHRGDGTVRGLRLADVVEEVAKELAVFGLSDSLQGSAQQPDVVAVQHPGVVQGHGQVEARLAAQGGQDALGPLLGDDALDDFHGQGFNVNVVGDVRVGHNGGRVGVDEHDGNALFPQ